MSTFLRRLFSTAANPADGLSQSQREAIIDLLNFCMCADSKLKPSEAITIEDEISGFDWDPAVDFELFVVRSLERASSAMSTPEARQAALASISDRLQTTEARSNALDLCPKVFHADGEFAPEERTVFIEIKRAFGRPE
jgi:uncharacterized tellurite resistance protein B-like protein